jgi:hypothetical protein
MANSFPIYAGLLQGNVLAQGFTISGLGSLDFNSASTGLTLHNTADEVTNYERAAILWNANTFKITLSKGGSGTGRVMQITTNNYAAAGVEACVSITPQINQSGTAGYTGLLVNVTENSIGNGSTKILDLQIGGSSKFSVTGTAVSHGDGTINTQQGIILASGSTSTFSPFTRIIVQCPNSSAVLTQMDAINFKTISNTAAAEKSEIYFQNNQSGTVTRCFSLYPGGYALFPTTQNLHFYNTADEITNYERLNIGWSANVLTLAVEKGGTGLGRHLQITLAGEASAASVQNLVSILPTVAQSGTAGYTALLLNVTQSSTGSGTKLLADFQVGGASKVAIDNTGNIYTAAAASPPYNGSIFVGGNLPTTAVLTLHQACGIIWRNPLAAVDTKVWSWESVSNRFALTLSEDSLATRFWLLEFNRTTTTLNFMNLIQGRFGLNVAHDVTPLARFHVIESTLGNLIDRWETTTAADPVLRETITGRVATTDATLTTIVTVPLTASQTYYFQVRVWARRTGGAAGTPEDGAAYFIRACYKTVAGSATIIGAQVTDTPMESQAAFDCQVNPSGASVLVQVQGVANNNMTWHAEVSYWHHGT